VRHLRDRGRESVGVIRAFSRRFEAADALAERPAAKFFSCGKFDLARLFVRLRVPRRELCGACACKAIVVSDVAETRIPSALMRCFEFLVEVCADAKTFNDASGCGSRCRYGGSARTGIYTQN